MFSVLYLANKARPAGGMRVRGGVSWGLRGVRRVVTASCLLVVLSLY